MHFYDALLFRFSSHLILLFTRFSTPSVKMCKILDVWVLWDLSSLKLVSKEQAARIWFCSMVCVVVSCLFVLVPSRPQLYQSRFINGVNEAMLSSRVVGAGKLSEARVKFIPAIGHQLIRVKFSPRALTFSVTIRFSKREWARTAKLVFLSSPYICFVFLYLTVFILTIYQMRVFKALLDKEFIAFTRRGMSDHPRLSRSNKRAIV